MCKTYTTKETVNYMGINMKIYKKKLIFLQNFILILRKIIYSFLIVLLKKEGCDSLEKRK